MIKNIKPILVGLGLIGFAATAHSADLAGVDVHGFISQGYLKSSDYNYHADTEDGTFEFNEFGINFGKQLTDDLRVGLQLFSRDLGDTGNNEVTLDWAYGDYRWKDWLGVRAGKIKMPHGLYNETRDVDALRNSIFLPASVYPETLRDLNLALMGGGIYGNVDLGGFGGISYQALGGTVDVDDDEARLGYHARAAAENITSIETSDIAVDSRYAMALVWDTPVDGLRLGGTYNATKMSTEAKITSPLLSGGEWNITTEYNSITNAVASIEYTWNDLVLVAEYIRSKYDYDDDLSLGSTHLNRHVDMTTDGWYVGASYRFTDWLEIGGYYSQQHNNVDDRDGSNSFIYNPSHRAWLKDTCLTARFDVNEYWSIKLEGHAFEGTTGLYPIDNLPGDDQEWWDKGEKWNLVAAKVTFAF
jgi:predicted porin